MCTASSGTTSSYPMVWVRAVTSRGHHLVTCISKDGGGTEYGAAVKGRATISRDNGQSTVRLQLNNLRAEDTGTYYCTRSPGGYSCAGGWYGAYAGQMDVTGTRVHLHLGWFPLGCRAL